MKSVDECRRDEVEPVGVRGAAVQETDGRAPDNAPFEKAQSQPTDDDGTLARELAS